MDPNEHLIVAKGKVITEDIRTCQFDNDKGLFFVQFEGGEQYTYKPSNLIWLQHPTIHDPQHLRIVQLGRPLLGVSRVQVFKNSSHEFWRVSLSTKRVVTCARSELEVSRSCLVKKSVVSIAHYLRECAALSPLLADDGKALLTKHYDKLVFIDEESALAAFIDPAFYPQRQQRSSSLVFPFGTNGSQLTAVQRALENQISIVQGPPGTGKTQTILNILANLLIAGKTVQVVSNNNSAITNVLKKLDTPEYGLGFLVASLGNSSNRQDFVSKQTGLFPPSMSAWEMRPEDKSRILEEVTSLSNSLIQNYRLQEELAALQQEVAALEVEFRQFEMVFANVNLVLGQRVKTRKGLNSTTYLRAWRECEAFTEKRPVLSIWFLFKTWWLHGVRGLGRLRHDPAMVILLLQRLFYVQKRIELSARIDKINEILSARNHDQLTTRLQRGSLDYLHSTIFDRIGGREKRAIFTETDLTRDYKKFLHEYPIVLSTTFSSRSSVSQEAFFDYVIVDEASQVDIATGALALSCAQNAVIVGDSQQLPNVVKEDQKLALQEVFEAAGVSDSYDSSTKSFLDSVCLAIPEAPQTLLREHYRCHPKIIGFCNRMFYGGKLLIMTADAGEENVISVTRTVEGNHFRDNMNQRQVDVLLQEVLPRVSVPPEKIGIITGYRNQVQAITTALTDLEIDVATVHKFQGREKDVVIISTVDDILTEFADDPHLMNVAVSRAKKGLHLIVSGNKLPVGSNLAALIAYVEYNEGPVVVSAISSVFDYLYRQYAASREVYLRKHRRISQFDSENLMAALLEEVLAEPRFTSFEVAFQHPLWALILDKSLLDEEEHRYASQPATHVDFLVYHRFTKKPLLAIEVDGHEFHKDGTKQAERDKKKDVILEKYGFRLLRLKTTGSGEREKIRHELAEIIK